MVTLKFNAIEIAMIIAIFSALTAACGFRMSIEDKEIGYSIAFGICIITTTIIFALLRMAS